jgi:uncharacterized protein (DUF4415 family)
LAIQFSRSSRKSGGGKKQVAISIRLDADMLAFFRDQGAGWQTRMNAILRAWYEAQKSPPISKEAGDVDGPAPDA